MSMYWRSAWNFLETMAFLASMSILEKKVTLVCQFELCTEVMRIQLMVGEQWQGDKVMVSHEGGAHIVCGLVPFLKCFRLTGVTGGHGDTDG